MNWIDFKEEIDMVLERNGIDPNEEIWYIDISFPDTGVSFVIDEDTVGIGISN